MKGSRKSGVIRPMFTLQRLCELLLEGEKYYPSCYKYMFALEKVGLVESHGIAGRRGLSYWNGNCLCLMVVWLLVLMYMTIRIV